MKKTLSAFICIVILILSVTASVPSAFAASYSGKCGDTLTWSLDTFKGVLTVEGSGKCMTTPPPTTRSGTDTKII